MHSKTSPVNKKTTFKDANTALKGAKKRGEPSVTFMIAVGKPMKSMPKRGQRTTTNKMSKMK